MLAAVGMGVVIFMYAWHLFLLLQADLIKILLTGIISCYSLDHFFGSGRISNPSTSLVGFATCAFWAAILEPILLIEKKFRLMEIGLGIGGG
ncbi:MAG: hypothetical protein U5K54_18640 [Cytophagales bacterium]|nr:hypothetical protein [Cytophagales bacterium]